VGNGKRTLAIECKSLKENIKYFKQKEIEEDKLKNTLTDNIAPHYWGKDRLIARIRLL
jgi:hypothetical protein